MARNVRNRLQNIPLLAPLGLQLGPQNRPSIVLGPWDLPVIKRHQFVGLTFYSKIFERIAILTERKLMTGKSLIFSVALNNQDMSNPEKARSP